MIVEDRKFGMPPPAESADADRLFRRVTVIRKPPGGKTDQYDLDIDGRGNVMRYTAILH